MSSHKRSLEARYAAYKARRAEMAPDLPPLSFDAWKAVYGRSNG